MSSIGLSGYAAYLPELNEKSNALANILRKTYKDRTARYSTGKLIPNLL